MMGHPIPEATRAAIVRALVRNEFRAGEFHEALAKRYGVSGWYVRRVAAQEKQEQGRAPFTSRAMAEGE